MNLPFLDNALYMLGLALSLFSLAYLMAAVRYVKVFGRRRIRAPQLMRPVTILKPVCGLDQDLYDNLRSFCEQDYPKFQVVFGVSGRDDPAVEVVERLIDDLPEHDLALVVSNRSIGSNRKINNLANAYGLSKHAYLVIADSDMRVGRNYLREIMAEFDDPKVGAVTCLYKGSPVKGIASLLGAAFINEWFLPSVLVSIAVQELRFCFGATMAVRRDVLDQIGGFDVLASYLADDYMLGALVSDCGYEVRLATYVVQNIVFEPDLRSLFVHELRWARTVRSVRPVGYAFSVLTHAIPISLLFMLLCHSYYVGGPLVSAAVTLRLVLQRAVGTSVGLEGRGRAWCVPFRDISCFAVWAASFFGRDVEWRQQRFSVQADGQMTAKETNTA